MSIVSSLFAITKHVLGIYRTKQAREYLDRVIYLEKLRYEELKRPEDECNHALLDNIDNELCIISEASAKFGQPQIED